MKDKFIQVNLEVLRDNTSQNIFFPDFNIRLYDKNSESDYFFFPSTKIRIFFFFSNIENQNIFLENKCGHRNVLSKRQVWMSIFHIINFKKKIHGHRVLDFFFIKKLILDFYFCLKSGPVFLFQIFIIAPLPLPLPRDIKLYQSQQFFIFLFKPSKHNIYLAVKFTNKIHPSFFSCLNQ